MKMLRYWGCFIFIIMPHGLVVAQDIPLPLLESDRKSCKASCEKSYSGKQCNQLCDCTISALHKKVSFDRYLQLTSEISKNKLSKSNAALMSSIAEQCSKEIFKTESGADTQKIQKPTGTTKP